MHLRGASLLLHATALLLLHFVCAHALVHMCAHMQCAHVAMRARLLQSCCMLHAATALLFAALSLHACAYVWHAHAHGHFSCCTLNACMYLRAHAGTHVCARSFTLLLHSLGMCARLLHSCCMVSLHFSLQYSVCMHALMCAHTGMHTHILMGTSFAALCLHA